MSNQSLADQVRSDIQSLQSSLRKLQDAVRLSDIRDNVEDLQTSVNGMDQRIASLRERGYAFEKELEGKAASHISTAKPKAWNARCAQLNGKSSVWLEKAACRWPSNRKRTG